MHPVSSLQSPCRSAPALLSRAQSSRVASHLVAVLSVQAVGRCYSCWGARGMGHHTVTISMKTAQNLFRGHGSVSMPWRRRLGGPLAADLVPLGLSPTPYCLSLPPAQSPSPQVSVDRKDCSRRSRGSETHTHRRQRGRDASV